MLMPPAQEEKNLPQSIPAQAGVTQYTVHLPSEFVPNDYFIPTLVISIVCTIASFSTIFFTAAALICSILAWVHRARGVYYYVQAKRFGQAALILDIIALLWFFAWGFVTMSLLSYFVFVVVPNID